jgi:hypothetical protein
LEIGIITIINQILGWMTVRSKARGKLYAILGLVADFYLLYLSYEFFKNSAITRSLLIFLAFIILLYFSVLNIFYYFTNKKISWDISPILERILGTNESDIDLKIVPANGLYDSDNVLPTTIVYSSDQQKNLINLLEEMKNNKLISEGFGNLSFKKQKQIILRDGFISSNYPGNLIPFFDLKYAPQGIIVYGGMNQLSAQPIGLITKVGLASSILVINEYKLSLASVTILDSRIKNLQNQEQIVVPTIKAKIAYVNKKRL